MSGEDFLRISLVISGVVNLLPSTLALFPNRLRSSYGLNFDDPNALFILQHRAVLFGIIGCILLLSAGLREFYFGAIVIGLISMVSFVILYFANGINNSAKLKKVMWIDVFCSVLLILAFLICNFT